MSAGEEYKEGIVVGGNEGSESGCDDGSCIDGSAKGTKVENADGSNDGHRVE